MRPLLVCLALTLAAPLAAAPEGAVAVMPFKNLNQEEELDWLRVGIAETMISDLKKGGVAVVERDQLDRALAELALQETSGAEAASAARVGRMVGAHTVVVGGYQRAGKQVRITARFVVVETGIVRDTAKSTGPLTRIFRLQDEIVAKLVGKPAPSRKPKPRPKQQRSPPKPVSEEKTLDAYRLYSLSLVTSSDAERARFLKKAVALDPSFTYALDDLAKLERRIKRYDARADEVRDAIQQRAYAVLDDDTADPEKKAQVAFQLLTSLTQAFRYKALLAAAERVHRMDLPLAYGTSDVREYASYAIVYAHYMRKESDLMLQAGERHLQEFPGGTYYSAVSMWVQAVISERRRHAGGADETKKALAKIEEERAKVLADERTEPYREVRMMSFDFQRCSAGNNHREHRTVIEECRAFLRKWDGSDDDNAETLLLSARHLLVLAHAELGDFESARELAEAWLAEDPKSASDRAIPTLLSTWPRD